MPILHISLASDILESDRKPSEVFAHLAAVPPEFVTVTITRPDIQCGNGYRAMVQLILPDLLLPQARPRMLEAAVQMLDPCYDVVAADAIAHLTLVASGSVLDRGQVQEWEASPR